VTGDKEEPLGVHLLTPRPLTFLVSPL
jgi:hypothetical protein